MGIMLTEEEKAFLNKYGISPLSVMDGKGLPPKEYVPLLRETGKLLAWGVSPCAKQAHRLRNAHGRCVMCDPATLAFSKRHRKPGYVYVAYSVGLKRVKVGLTKDKDDRADQLNLHKLGGFCDWEIRKLVYCERVGEVESAVQKKLAKFQVNTPFSCKAGYCRETFNCSLRTATNALSEVISNGEGACALPVRLIMLSAKPPKS